jgi:NADP-dependent 3-hydroxy acid dehydrogenase YdfG
VFAGDVLTSESEQIERVIADFRGVVNGTKAFLPHLIASGDGHVANISSLFGLLAVPSQHLQRQRPLAFLAGRQLRGG